MKKLSGLILGLALILTFNSCEKDDDKQTEQTLQEQISNGEWIVTHLQEIINGVQTNEQYPDEAGTYFITFTETSYSMYETSAMGIAYEEEGTYTVVDGNVITTTHPNFGVMTFVVAIKAEDEIIFTQDICGSFETCDEGETKNYVWTLNLVTE